MRRARQAVFAFMVIAILAIVLAAAFRNGDEAVPQEPRAPRVETASVRSLSAQQASLLILGSVQSQNGVTILTEAQGQITSLNYELGDFVPAGAVIAELSNASERARVSQANASLAKLQSQSARVRTTTYAQAVQTYRGAFITADDAVRGKAEPFFINSRSQFPQLVLAVTSNEELEEGRAAIRDILRDWETQLKNFSTGDDILPRLARAREHLRFIESFLNDLTNAANRQTNGSVVISITDTDRANLQAGRIAVRNELNALIAIESDLRQTLPDSTPGGTGELEAQIQVAEAALSAARAALEKTIIRAPIPGTINRLRLERGDFVSSFKEVATIANNNMLEVEAFITEHDRAGIAVGNRVLIDNRYQGSVARIAPALDPQTKKIEVKISIEDGAAALTSGESVEVAIERGNEASRLDEESPYPVPISALKITATEMIVFTIDSNNRLVPNQVTAGPIVGEKIFVETGLTPNMEIVTDARGLQAGQQVSRNTE